MFSLKFGERNLQYYTDIASVLVHNKLAKRYTEFVISNGFDGMNLEFVADEWE